MREPGASAVEYEVIKENLSLIVDRLEHELCNVCCSIFQGFSQSIKEGVDYPSF